MKHLPTYNKFINEEEVSVEKALTPQDRKKLKDAFESRVIGVDKISFKRDGTIVAKQGYFYRHGATPEKLAEQVKGQLAAAGIEIEVTDTYDDFKPWPKDSNLVVEFKMN